jgi:hypothetical protein
MTAPVTKVENVPEPLSWFCTMAETIGLKNYFLNLGTAPKPEVEPLQRVTNSGNGLSVCVEPLIDASGVNREVRYGFSQDLQPRVGTECRNQANPIAAYSLLLQVLQQTQYGCSIGDLVDKDHQPCVGFDAVRNAV